MTIKCLVFLSAASFYSTGARRYPLSYVYSGLYLWGISGVTEGVLQYQSSDGLIWSLSPGSVDEKPAAYYLRLNAGMNKPQELGVKQYGFALRWRERPPSVE
ncbi:hypothetical protein IK112_02425 [Candidatus Saccharibacteria bacterium]|nr:hypothetical protein [Candidatus Saccharibacteria bacterium]